VTHVLRAGLLDGVRILVAYLASRAGAYSSGCRFERDSA
jgi:hypothetical protein